MNAEERGPPACRFCAAPLRHTFANLGSTPLANAYLAREQLEASEPFYPLHAYVCERCLLVQLRQYEPPEHIFTDYAYFSSYSDSWLRHAEAYADLATQRFGLGARSLVLEIASNDGYLLQYFHRRGVPVLGVEPAANVAQAALERGIPTRVMFFGSRTASDLVAEGCGADLLVGNNVLAHVPDLNDFVAGIRIALKPSGVCTLEFPHLLRLMEENQFDTIYHEHFSYFSALAVERVFAAQGLRLFDVEELPTHGGSLRIYVRHADVGAADPDGRVASVKAAEIEAGMDRVATYLRFDEQVKETKRKLLLFLIDAKSRGMSIVGYGAPAKGNTLLNYCGIGSDFLDYVVDRSPHKQGRFLPGTRIPICAPERIRDSRPDYIVILPWNLREEIMGHLSWIREWGGQFVVPIPEPRVYP